VEFSDINGNEGVFEFFSGFYAEVEGRVFSVNGLALNTSFEGIANSPANVQTQPNAVGILLRAFFGLDFLERFE